MHRIRLLIQRLGYDVLRYPGSKPQIWVWDSNPFNPYGAEVARVLSDTQPKVQLLARRGVICGGPQVDVREVLPRGRSGRNRVGQAASHLFAALRAVSAAAIQRPVIVLPWLSTPIDRLLLCGLRLFGVRVVVVYHNPIHGREDGVTRLAAAAATLIVVHDPRLLGSTSRTRTRVAHHPSYAGWWAQIQHIVGDLVQEPGSQVLIAGMTRADKGARLYPEIARKLKTAGAHLRIESSNLPAQLRAELGRIEGVALTSVGIWVCPRC